MKTFVLASLLTLINCCGFLQARAQNATQATIIFVEEEKDEAREQLKRILSRYDLDQWIFTKKVKIEAGVDPHSHPILTLNTDFLDSDELQLSIFLHEQAHWFVGRVVPPRTSEEGTEVPIIQELREMYPNAPVSDYSAYLHLIVAWVELDAMAEVVGEEAARRVAREKVERLAGEAISEVDKRYRWYNMRVLEDTEAIGKVLQEHGFVITPENGLQVGSSER